ncbi:MAG: hypothetical protein IT379_20455 [Deltaproteobacteria bacterium]|nr:hypothetical protein [Deltaproteobacteria bacterium]
MSNRRDPRLRGGNRRFSPFAWLFGALFVVAACKGGGPGESSSTRRDGSSPPPSGDASVAPPVPTPPPSPVASCAGCRGDQVCVDGTCTDVPTSCPCPRESYCDLASSRCVVGCVEDTQCSRGRICVAETRSCQDGCRQDADCGAGGICEGTVCRGGCRADGDCGSGQICEGTTCRAGCRTDGTCTGGQICVASECRDGCRADGSCPGAGQICDVSSMTCRGGCRTDVECGSEQICDVASSTCAAGCRDDSGCGPGRICESGLCRDGCREHGDCPLSSYCGEGSVCVEGCGPDGEYQGITDRCPVGQACVPNVCGGSGHCNWHCQEACYGWDCASSPEQPFECFNDWGSSESASGRRCREACDSDADCGAGQVCTWFTRNASVPGEYRTRLCARPCTADGDCSGSVDSYGDFTASCTCRADGHCRWTEEYVCYHVSPGALL